MEELSRSHIVSCDDELGEMPNFDICGTFFKDLFENIDAETVTRESPRKDSEPKTEAQTESNRKRSSSIVILDDEEIEEFQRKQVAKNTAKGTESAVRRLQAWYSDRYGKPLELASINKTNASDLLKHLASSSKYEIREKIGLAKNTSRQP